MPFQIRFSRAVKCALTNVQAFPVFSCVLSILLRPDRSLFRFKLDPSVLYFLPFYRMVIFVGENSIPKALFKD